ncbi:sigma-70 family RNA polymerase sigma factor [Paraflavitalea sp. CAU 1676]|uniref:RNA polymerase sigma factor n=1 Tax=Paraflavitalea sp. CAU 1676 TaxID=3032598 RepID=UPI0023DA0E27|nr:sigma-70 family RNA polymerase sigma factor [Paraflavitalea sp. CAU 1676]MDF2192424.1 sigma-70 family RNA polymerase sigma factor [Paraflavitalea sp. CAU 1676]
MLNTQPYNDCWLAFKNGDQEAFNSLFNSFWEPLFQFAYRGLNDIDEAKEAVQELFIYLWTNKENLAIPASVEAYLFTALKNRMLNLISKRKTYQQKLQVVTAARETNEVWEKMNAKDNEKQVRREVEQLPDRMKQVVYLSEYSGLTIPEIAAVTGTSEQTVRNQLSQAMKKLKAQCARLLHLF